ncbi:hypothetical protein BJV78DRAFT_1157422 [Lactifluus subvellereus]|nr:hypothetical protein BJV78DRAFT_1157422 [Lactifluus subvellereus]
MLRNLTVSRGPNSQLPPSTRTTLLPQIRSLSKVGVGSTEHIARRELVCSVGIKLPSCHWLLPNKCQWTLPEKTRRNYVKFAPAALPPRDADDQGRISGVIHVISRVSYRRAHPPPNQVQATNTASSVDLQLSLRLPTVPTLNAAWGNGLELDVAR